MAPLLSGRGANLRWLAQQRVQTRVFGLWLEDRGNGPPQ